MTNTPLNEVPSMREELRELKADNGLLKLSNEQLAHNYQQADRCAQEREAQILDLLRERDAMAALLEEIVQKCNLFPDADYMVRARDCLSRIRRGK